jgi:hypothetical protein
MVFRRLWRAYEVGVANGEESWQERQGMESEWNWLAAVHWQVDRWGLQRVGGMAGQGEADGSEVT